MENRKEIEEFILNCGKENILTVATKQNKAPNGYPWKEGNAFNHLCYGVGVATGQASDGVEILDFDNNCDDLEEIFEDFFHNEMVSNLYAENKIVAQETPSGGYHIVFRSDSFTGNKKLANVWGKNTAGKPSKKVIIETRGDNGYFVCYPTPNYKPIGFFMPHLLSKISEEERTFLIELAMSFDRAPDKPKKDFNGEPYVPKPLDENSKPWHRFNEEGVEEAKQILRAAGWTQVTDTHWERPDKSEGSTSATFGFVAPNVFYVFSSNAYPFEPEKSYKPFSIKTLLEHGGDFKASSRDLYNRERDNKGSLVMTDRKIEIKAGEAIDNVAPNEEGVFDEVEYLLDPTKDIQKPPTLLSVKEIINTPKGIEYRNISLFSEGDISMLQGQQKSKKSFFSSAIAASMLRQGVFPKFQNENNINIAYIDTEQSPYYAQMTNRRIHQLSKSINYSFYSCRTMTTSQRRITVERHLEKNPNCKFVILDGIVDLVDNFNDLESCKELVQWLMTITKKYGVHILNILHENIGGMGKARGHLGTMLAQKAETVIRIEKDETDNAYSTISAKDVRGKPFKPFNIAISDRGNIRFSAIE
jgi:hypothetical protein